MPSAFSMDSDGSAPKTREKLHARSAPVYDVPTSAIVSIEHPFIIENVSKGIETLGGAIKVQELIQQDASTVKASLYLRPDDRMSKPIQSTNVKTNNVVVQITVPKRTGRKRKRGSDEPYPDIEADAVDVPIDGLTEISKTSTATEKRDTKYLLQRLQDNPSSYTLKPIGSIEQTHRFRSMPDFAYSTTNNAFMKKMREHILPFEYDRMRGFHMDMSRGVKENIELLPPPSLSHIRIPFNYSYRQNSSVKQTVDAAGNLTTINTQLARKIKTQLLTYDAKEIPTEPAADVAPLDSLDPKIQRLVARIKPLLDERPIWSRRALSNQVRDKEWVNVGKLVYQYVGYMFRSGPWRDAVVRFGVDPRTDPKYRFYQTMTFQIWGEDQDSTVKRVKSNRRNIGGAHSSPRQPRQFDKQSHIFDGIKATMDGKVWQVCDMTDPILNSIASTANLRNVCHIKSDGYYHNGTWAKLRTIFRDKLMNLVLGRGLAPNDPNYDYANIVNIPDALDESNWNTAVFKKGDVTMADFEMQLASVVRTMAGYPTGRKGRLEGARVVNRENVYVSPRNGGIDEDADERIKQAMFELDAMDPLDDEGDTDDEASAYGSGGEDGEDEDNVEVEEDEDEENVIDGEDGE